MTEYTDQDMADVGRALMDAIDANINDPWLKGWAPAQCPSEIVGDLLNKLDELQSRRAASEEGDGWRTIESAPKDGAVLGYDEHERTRVVLWGGHNDWLICGSLIKFEPTHWMPLPSAPRATHTRVDRAGGADSTD